MPADEGKGGFVHWSGTEYTSHAPGWNMLCQGASGKHKKTLSGVSMDPVLHLLWHFFLISHLLICFYLCVVGFYVSWDFCSSRLIDLKERDKEQRRVDREVGGDGSNWSRGRHDQNVLYERFFTIKKKAISLWRGNPEPPLSLSKPHGVPIKTSGFPSDHLATTQSHSQSFFRAYCRGCRPSLLTYHDFPSAIKDLNQQRMDTP